jgi:hypothetical protein
VDCPVGRSGRATVAARSCLECPTNKSVFTGKHAVIWRRSSSDGVMKWKRSGYFRLLSPILEITINFTACFPVISANIAFFLNITAYFLVVEKVKKRELSYKKRGWNVGKAKRLTKSCCNILKQHDFDGCGAFSRTSCLRRFLSLQTFSTASSFTVICGSPNFHSL